jgi:Common central domain of tyrosinase/Polyphenol oxidase middle domain
MDKSILYAVILFLCVIVTGSFKKKEAFNKVLITKQIIECYPDNYDYYPKMNSFVVSPNQVMIIRSNINSLSTNDSTQFSNAVKAMQNRSSVDVNDPLGWAFQARIHNGPIDSNVPSKPFMTCQHGQSFFLSWHRMYMYFFERILRFHMATNSLPKPGLPYWDYSNTIIPKIPATATIKGSIPGMFRFPIINNPLYDARRSPSFNAYPNGAPLNNQISAVNFTSALNNNPSYFSFENSLKAAHGFIHTQIATWQTGIFPNRVTHKGDMAEPTTAATDPIFFVHHSNIDRLWEKWLNMGGGRRNPVKTCDDWWWKKSFKFYDETGQAKIMSGQEIINTASALLNYKYDDTPAPPISNVVCTTKATLTPTFPIPTSSIYLSNNNINKSIVIYNFSSATITPKLENIIRVNGNSKFNFSNAGLSDDVYLEFEDIKIINPPVGIIEVYLNPIGFNLFQLQPFKNNYLGALDLFTASAAINHRGMHKDDFTQRININEVLKKQELKFSDLKKMKLVFVVKGTNNFGVEVLSDANIKIGKTSVSIYKYNELYGRE